MGYRNKWKKLDSSRFGSAQKRVRAFMLSRLGAEPPDLPECAPNAPSLCLRDIMEPTRNERYVRRIPLDRVRWRQGYEPSAGVSTPTAEDTGESFYSRRMLYSSSSSSPTLRRLHSLKDMVKAVAGPGSSTPVAEEEGKVYYPDRVLYSSSSPTVCTDHHNNRIKVVADMERPKHLDYQNRLYSSSSSSPSLISHGGSDHEVKVVAEDAAKAYGSSAKVLSSSSSPTLRAQAHGLQNQPKVMDSEDGGDLVVSVLTPRECWRLMGFPEWAYLRASRVCSETQLYNQAGNSIVVEVLVAIFCAMLRPQRRVVQATFGVGA